MKMDCPLCGRTVALDHRAAGRTVRCEHCGKSFVAPAELAVVGQNHTLTPFPISSLVVLHYVTAGLFTIIHLNMLHERMPRLRRTDPTATVAVGLCFVPVVNIYWFFFTFARLCERINEQRRFNGLVPAAPQWLAIPISICVGCGTMAWFFPAFGFAFLGALTLVLMPVLAAMAQAAINNLCETRAPAIPAIS